ncbi:MAG: dTMP kinase [Flavobacteriales bacterium]|jgi:dTMP kinase|nr:dTMP kinase [Flavobacteriales bacterium]|tara:strand:- start:693 stop:1310 length:618 start_codon:yes stop_codon:yes gene_type:complete
MVKSIFIVLDGMDGSGKSEVVRLLHDYLLKNNNYRVLTTMEPSDGKCGKEIRDILAKEEDPQVNGEKLVGMFIKDREDHLKNTIIPFLNKSNGHEANIVICDRYYYSTIAFQATQGLDGEMLIEINKDFLKPDIAFIMDINPETALERIKGREKEKFEKLEFMNKLREKFLELPRLLKDNIKIIDASKGINEVFEDIKKEVDKLL